MRETAVRLKRLNVNLTQEVHDELRELSDRSGRSMTDIVKTGLGLVHVALDVAQSKNTLAVADSDGKLVGRIVVAI